MLSTGRQLTVRWILITAALVFTLAAPSLALVAINTSFDDYPEGSYLPGQHGWTGPFYQYGDDPQDTLGPMVENTAGDHRAKWQCMPGSDIHWVTVKNPLPGEWTSGTAVMYLDLGIDATDGPGIFSYLQLFDSLDCEALRIGLDRGTGVTGRIFVQGKNGPADGDSTEFTVVQDPANNTMYKLKLEIDTTDRTYNVYVGDGDRSGVNAGHWGHYDGGNLILDGSPAAADIYFSYYYTVEGLKTLVWQMYRCGSEFAGSAYAMCDNLYMEGPEDADGSPRTEIWVAKGTYVEQVSLRQYAYLYGGFSGSETSKTDRKGAANQTIIDVSSLGANATAVTGADVSSIDGFTIKGSCGVNCASSAVRVTNNVISNCAQTGVLCGGTVSTIPGLAPVLMNNTIVADGVGVSCPAGTPTLRNNIISLNTTGIAGSGGAPALFFNDVSGNTTDYSGISAGPQDIQQSPMFVSAAQGNYRLTAGSPCIDAGDNSVVLPWDRDGSIRPADGNRDGFAYMDIGAYEYVLPPPGPVTNFSVTVNGLTNNLRWTNPSDSIFVGTMIRVRTDAYPTGNTDGDFVCNKQAAPGSADSFSRSGLVSGTTYYYAAYAYDSIPNYSAATTATSMTLPDWIIDTFDSYADGDLTAQGSWLSTGSVSDKVTSSFAKGGAGKSVLCDTIAAGASVANQINFADKTTGSILVSFDVAQDATGTAGQELAYLSVYGADSSAEIMRIHIQKGKIFAEYGPANPGSLALLSITVGNLTWNNVKIGFNIDAKTMDFWLDGNSKGTGYAWKTGATRVSKIVIGSDRNTNLSPQKCYIDNLRVEPKPGQVASVSDDGGWSPSLSKLHFSFPSVAGTPEYEYAIGTTSGGAQTQGWTSCGTSTDVTATGLALTENTTTYYISVQCLNQFGTAGSSRTSNGIKIGAGLAKIKDAKALADGTSSQVKALRGKLVSAIIPPGVSPGGFYIQEPDGPSGLKAVSTATVYAGDQVDICGVMKGSGAERYMDCTGNGVFRTAGPGGPYPAAISAPVLGGSMLNSYTPGVVGGSGLNNIGLLISIFGRVTQRQTADPKHFYVDDGSGLKDGTATGGVLNVGVRILGDPADYAEGSYVSVTGTVSCFGSSGLRPEILPVSTELLKAP